MTARRRLEATLGATDAAAIERLLSRPSVGTFALRPRGASRSRETLLDTSDWAVARMGATLAIRRRGARRELEALWTRARAAPWRETRILSTALSGGGGEPTRLPEGPVRDQLRAAIALRPLAVVADLSVVRRRLDAFDARGRLVARVAVTSVSAAVPGGIAATRFDEVTIARVDPGADAAAALVAALRARGLRAGARGGRERVLAALHGEAVFHPRLAGPVLRDDALGEAARKTVAEHLARLQENDPGTREGRDPEALHDQRVASRRIRAALRFFAPAFPAGLHGKLVSDLRWLGRHLGRVRDLDVQIERLAATRRRGGAGVAAGIAPAARRLHAERAAARIRLLAALDGRRYLRLIAELDAFALGAPGAEPEPAAAIEPVAPAAAAALARLAKRFRRSGDAARDDPTPTALHRLRIRAKRLRYALEFVGEAAGKSGRRLVGRLVRLQDLLGEHQDAVVGGGLAAKLLADEGLAPAERAGVEAVLREEAAEARRLRARFGRAWRPFAEAAFRGEVDRVVARLARSHAKKKGDAVSGVP